MTTTNRDARRKNGHLASTAEAQVKPSSEATCALGDLPSQTRSGNTATTPQTIKQLAQIVVEDWTTHGSSTLSPGFLAIANHRVRGYAERKHGVYGSLLSGASRAAAVAIDWVWGVQINKHVQLGRRVRIWHHGCVFLDAQAVGDDVHFRHNTTLGRLRGGQATREALPILESGVDVGSGACVLGPVRVGKGAVIGANTLVMKDVPAGVTILGVPGRVIPT
ncbi:MAG TPA: hypothetical protein VHM70_14155 [Polyangiaceae bacterium]|jgi:serine O-acetyltransferase|nr:hypothetical protein [Polyangiaceae bacterium]